MGTTANLNTTTIDHEARKALGLTLNEYAVADTINKKQTDPDSDYPGWCLAYKKELAEQLGLTQVTIFTILNKLIAKGIIERHAQTKHLRTTRLWFNTSIFSQNKESLVDIKKISKEKESNKEREYINTRLALTKVNTNGSKEPSGVKKPKYGKETNYQNPYVYKILTEHKKLTQLERPTDKDPGKAAWNFHQRYGADNFLPALNWFQENWPKVELTSIAAVTKNYSVYQRDGLGKSRSSDIPVPFGGFQ